MSEEHASIRFEPHDMLIDVATCVSYQYIGASYYQYVLRGQYGRWLRVQYILGYRRKIFRYVAHQYHVQYMLANGGTICIIHTNTPCSSVAIHIIISPR